MSEIIKTIQIIRNYINKPRKQNILLSNKHFGNQLCSSLDIVEDTELAIDSYLILDETADNGLKYLYVFGILQILFVQQDAVINMAESLGTNFELDDDLKNIRMVRNNSIGHPTKRGGGLNSKYNYIFRAYLSQKNLSLMTVSPNEQEYTKFYHYNILKLITSQRKSVNKLLLEISSMLKKEEKLHKEQFKSEKLSDVFPNTLSYHFQKLTESSLLTAGKELRKGNFNIIKNSLKDFESELKKRDSLNAYIGVNIVLEELKYPMGKLDKYFSDEIELDNEEVYIYKYFVEKQFDELIEMSKEIDKDYLKNV